MIDKTKYNTRCAYLIPDGTSCLCSATGSDFIKDHIRFCPLDCPKFKDKNKNNNDAITPEGGSHGSL